MPRRTGCSARLRSKFKSRRAFYPDIYSSDRAYEIERSRPINNRYNIRREETRYEKHDTPTYLSPASSRLEVLDELQAHRL